VALLPVPKAGRKKLYSRNLKPTSTPPIAGAQNND